MGVPKYTNVKLELASHGSVALITLNRPQSGNSLHPILLQETLSAFRWAEKQSKLAVVILTGAGKFFCTGMELLEHKTEKVMSFDLGSDFHLLNRLLIESEKILVAAVNGPAAGYGVSSLALFDLVYCVPDAYFFTPFVKRGMAAEGASSLAFPRLMGHQKTAALFLAGERISADDAERLGLVNKVLSRECFIQGVLAIAEGMAKAPRGALRATKRLMKAPVLQALLDANDRECALIHRERYGSTEFCEAIEEFKNRKSMKQEARARL